jgi:hypothetical protein
MSPHPRPTWGFGADDDVEMIYDYNGERLISGTPSNNNNNNNNNNISNKNTNNDNIRSQSRQQQQQQQQIPPSRNSSSATSSQMNNNQGNGNGKGNKKMDSSSGSNGVRFSQVDFENVFDPFAAQEDDVAEFFDEDDNKYDANNRVDLDDDVENPNRVYSDPSSRTGVLNDAVHQIAGSPWAKPAYNPSNRPTDPLPIAKYTSGIALTLALGLVVFLLAMSIYNYTSIARIIVEVILAILSFFGLFWNSYFTVSSIMKYVHAMYNRFVLA